MRLKAMKSEKVGRSQKMKPLILKVKPNSSSKTLSRLEKANHLRHSSQLKTNYTTASKKFYVRFLTATNLKLYH